VESIETTARTKIGLAANNRNAMDDVKGASMSASLTEANFLEPTYRRAFIIWWALSWRSVLWTIGPGAAVGFVEAFIETKIAIPAVAMRYLPFGSGVVIGILVGIYVVRSVLRKKYRGFSIRLVAA
jgi:hypothetical protein